MLDKTEKGRYEIATRGRGLASRSRTLLLLVDGKTSRDNLLRNVAGLGVGEECLDELIAHGFVAETMTPPLDETLPLSGMRPVFKLSTPDIGTAEGEAKSGNPNGADDLNRIQAAHRFFNESIKEYIGLRGIGLQLKVERAATLEDYRALHRPFLDAVSKHKGEDMARGLKKRLYGILYKEGQVLPPDEIAA